MTHGTGADREHALLVMREGGRVAEWVVDADRLIGRDPSCDICIVDRQVSRRHATVRRSATGYVIVDHDSKNGTWVNGVRVAGSARLSDGDEVSIAARAKLHFVDAEATAPIAFTEHGLRLDTATLTVYLAGEPLEPPLSAPQWELVRLLYDAGGGVVTRDEIVERVWPDVLEGVSEDAVDALVKRLRSRLGEADPEHAYIVTVRGYGYRLDSG
jgi:DNA-binding response OmpR family regulator